jgi:hypothetical protein
MARPATALPRCACPGLALVPVFSLTKAMPLFWPLPAKLKPATVSTATVAFSFSRKWCSSAPAPASVRSLVAPAAAAPWTMTPLILFRQEGGRQAHEEQASTASMAR